MHPRTWLFYFFSLTLILALPIVIFNYWMDPLWTFSHSHAYNQNQVGFNERQLKTNKMYFNGLKKYDALLLGSSRSTYINQADFNGMKVFNLASADMTPYEYKEWIEIAKKIKNEEFKYIIIGLDFWASNKYLTQKKIVQNKTPNSYLNRAKELLYRYKSLISFDTFQKSRENLKHQEEASTIDYTRDNIKNTILVSPERKKHVSILQYNKYKNTIYGKDYIYDMNLKQLFLELKKANPKTKFIIFTTPISKTLFSLLIKQGNYIHYKNWMRATIDVFSEVHNFMGINKITVNPRNYPDLHHFYPFVGKVIAKNISSANKKMKKYTPATIVNKNNIENYFKQQDKLYTGF